MPSSTLRQRIVVLISGNGSNLQALIDDSRHEDRHYQVVGVLSNRADAYGLQRAQDAGIETAILPHTDFTNREAFDQALVEQIERWQPDWIVLAGFMRILTPIFTDHFLGQAINIHPSLLPRHRGLHTHQRALEAGDTEHGLSIHFVTPELDGGPLILQERLPILPEDTVESLQQRVHQLEHQCYPRVVEALSRGLIFYENGRTIIQNNKLKPPINLDQINALLDTQPSSDH